MTAAQLLTQSMQHPNGTDRRDSNLGAIYAVVMDADNCHCLTEELLDTWWHSQSPQDKAALFERQMEGDGAELSSTAPDFLTTQDLRLDGPLDALRHPLNAVYAATTGE